MLANIDTFGFCREPDIWTGSLQGGAGVLDIHPSVAIVSERPTHIGVRERDHRFGEFATPLVSGRSRAQPPVRFPYIPI